MSIASGIGDRLRTIDGLRVSEKWPNSIQTTAAIVNGPLTYEDEDMAGTRVAQDYEITLLLSMSPGVERADDSIGEYLAPSGPKSIRAALYADPTLGGNVQAFTWRGLTSPPGRIKVPRPGFEAEVLADEFYGAVIRLGTISAA